MKLKSDGEMSILTCAGIKVDNGHCCSFLPDSVDSQEYSFT